MIFPFLFPFAFPFGPFNVPAPKPCVPVITQLGNGMQSRLNCPDRPVYTPPRR